MDSINILSTKITSIPTAFARNCTSLKEINIPNLVADINSEAFYNCTSLNEINIPDNVKYIGVNSFNVENNNPIPNLIVYVTSDSVETLIKSVFNGIVINLSRK